MKASVSLWSADLMDVGTALDRLMGVVDRFPVGRHFVSDSLIRLDLVRKVRGRMGNIVDMYLGVAEVGRWRPSGRSRRALGSRSTRPTRWSPYENSSCSWMESWS